METISPMKNDVSASQGVLVKDWLVTIFDKIMFKFD